MTGPAFAGALPPLDSALPDAAGSPSAVPEPAIAGALLPLASALPDAPDSPSIAGLLFVAAAFVVSGALSALLRRVRRLQRDLETQGRLAAVVESTDDAVQTVSLDGTVLTWNPAAERLYGYTAAEMIGQPLRRIVPPALHEQLGWMLSAAAAGERRVQALDTLRVRKDGTLRAMSVTMSPIRDAEGQVVAVSAIARDITVLKAAQSAVAASEARLAGILSLAGDAIVSMDAEGRITLFNRRAEEVFGWKESEILGKPLDVLIPERFRAAHHGHVRAFAAAPAGHLRMEERPTLLGLRKDGTELPVEGSISKLEVGGSWLYTVVLRDITERKRAEAEREGLIARLQDALAQVRTLRGLVPICAWCKKVRDDEGYWEQVETYVTNRTEARFSHGICPECRAAIEREHAARSSKGTDEET